MEKKLPTELELCGRFGVGRSTVREAMRILEANGYVSIRRGSGAYVVSRTGNNYQSIGNWLHDNKDKLRDYMEVRIAIEQLSVRLMIKTWSDACGQRLSRHHGRFRGGDRRRGQREDQRHRRALP